jgi:hypothetical protein
MADDDISEGFEESESYSFTAHVHGKRFTVSAGDGSQRVKWLAHVAIARWDEATQQGWKWLGVPTSVKLHKKDGAELEMGAKLNDRMQNGDHVYVSTSLQPTETVI